MKDKNKHIIKLEDIKKDAVFTVPEKYFDELPGIIQIQTTGAPRKVNKFALVAEYFLSVKSLKYALPTVALVVGLFLFIGKSNQPEFNDMDLVEVSDDDILNYLAFYEDDETSLYNEVYSSDINIEMNDFIEVDESYSDYLNPTESTPFLDNMDIDENMSDLIELL